MMNSPFIAEFPSYRNSPMNFTPPRLCFHSAEEAQSFAMEVTKRACLKMLGGRASDSMAI
jgi:hypothetical protein